MLINDAYLRWSGRGRWLCCSASAALLVAQPAAAQSDTTQSDTTQSGQAAAPTGAAGEPGPAEPERPTVTGADPSSSQTEDIVITAQRRESRLQDTPAAVTALSSTFLERTGANRVEDVAKAVPSLTMPGASLNNNPAVAIRGISFYSGITAVSYPVAFYIDGLFTDRPYSIRDHLFDMERIEVLRGPQGVLFGRNATAGAIQLIHKLPDDDFTALARLEAGSFGTYQGQASVRGPIVEGLLQAGLAGFYAHSDGYVTNDVTGDKLFGEDSWGLRGTVRATPTPELEVILRGSYSNNENSFGIKNIVAFGTDTKRAIFNDPAYRPYHLGNDYQGFTDRDSYSVSLEASYDFGGAELISLTGYQGYKQHSRGDSDGTAVVRSENEQRNVNYSSISSELRLSSSGRSPLQWDVGLYYIHENPREFDNDVRLLIFPGGVRRRNGGTYFRLQETNANAYAAFAHAAWTPLERLTLRAGARYSSEKKAVDTDFDLYNATGAFTRIQGQDSETWNSFTPLFGLDYRWSDAVMTYATASKGFKSGGFNISPIAPFSPENVWNYEVGLKSDLLDRKLRLNLAAFYMDYRNIQVSKNTGNGLALIQNAASSTIKGIELETTLIPVRGLSITGSAAYIRARYDKFILDDRNPTGTNLGGEPLTRAPEWKTSIAADYEFAVTSGLEANLRASFSYEDEYYLEALIQPARRAYLRPSVVNVDLRAGVGPSNNRWELAAVVRNATNERYVSNLQNLLGGATRGAFFAQPRYFGGELSLRY